MWIQCISVNVRKRRKPFKDLLSIIIRNFSIILLHTKAVTGKETSFTHGVSSNLSTFKPINNIDFNGKQKLMKNKSHCHCSSFHYVAFVNQTRMKWFLCMCQFLQSLCCTSENILGIINGVIEIPCWKCHVFDISMLCMCEDNSFDLIRAQAIKVSLTDFSIPLKELK